MKATEIGLRPRGTDLRARCRAICALFLAFATSGALSGFGQIIIVPPPRDFGDAPKPYPDATHNIESQGFFLGARVDAETATAANDTATGDDLNSRLDDEEGITFATSPLLSGQTASVQVVVNISGGFLDAWIDFNKDGDWDDAGEQIFTSRSLVAGANNLTFTVPAAAVEGATFGRFRLSRTGGLKPGNVAGAALPTGEVEDYQVQIKKSVTLFDFGDTSSKYPVLLTQDGARHLLVQGFSLGKTIDVEPDGQPSVDATGDGTDEDGVVFLSSIKPGGSVDIEVTLSSPTGAQGLLDAWVDFNQNGSWLETNEKIFSLRPLSPGVNKLSFTVPSSAVLGTTFARFRMSQKGGLQPTGLSDTGEVEDYAVQIERDQFDFGDAPEKYPVTLAQDGARHIATRGVSLGSQVDDEPDGQPSANADRDDTSPAGVPDDEDGVLFLTNPLVPGSTAQVQVTASTGQGRLDAWIDFNGNGSWNDTGEQIFTSVALNQGVNPLTFTVPGGALLNLTAARFRYSLAGGLKPTGPAPNGEVEDYMVRIDRQLLDYGDAPQSYPVLLSQDGARHAPALATVGGPILGQRIDLESDGSPSATANGDDIVPSTADDEDGVVFPGGTIAPGQSQTVQVTASGGGRLDAWIDFNRDGDWADTGEKVFSSVALVSGINNLTFAVPADAVPGDTFSRFRLSSQGGLSFTGLAGNGEVEDHLVRIEAVELDFGDASEKYPVTLSQDGARHRIVKGVNLGRIVDAEKDGQPSIGANGDDFNPTAADDEDGVQFLDPLVAAKPARVEVVSSVGQARLDAWIDFNADGDWDDTGEHIFASLPLVAGTNTLIFTVPPTAVASSTYARFRLSVRGDLRPTGLAPEGEVEDYQVKIEQETLDFGDAARTYPVLLAQDGARHRVVEGFFLGKLVDTEADGQPNPTASGDDANPAGAGDDEDGVQFVGPLIIGETAQVQVTASQTGLLDAWIDFNRNSSWNEAGEQVFVSKPLAPGVNSLTFAVPSTATAGEGSYARFRFSRQGGTKPVGLAPDGEVEDYPVTLVQRTGPPCTDRTHRGTDFWLTFPGNYAPDADNPVRVRLYIVGVRETTGTVSIAGLSYSTNFVIPGSREKIIELPKAAELGNVLEVIENKGIHVTANAEVAVYGMNRVKWTSDGYLGLPSDVIGMNYVLLAYGNEFTGVPDLNGTQFALVATEDNTTVNITPKVATGAHPAGSPFSIVLNKGQTYQFRNTNGFSRDLTGSLIQANKRISVFGGHKCTTIPSDDFFFADHVVEQILPLERAGTFFVTAPLAPRTSDSYRFTAAYDGTVVTVNGVNLPVLNTGQFLDRVISGPVAVLATQPIFVGQYANSSDSDLVKNSDPFMMIVPHTAMWLNQYLVTAPDMNFVDHYINIVIPTASVASFLIDGVAAPGGSFSAHPSAPGMSYARLKVAPSVHSLTAQSAFGAWVYGWAEYDSYGFPAGLFFGDTEPPQLTCPPAIKVTLGTPVGGTVPGQTCTAVIPDLRSQVTVKDNCGLPERVVVSQTPQPGTVVGPGVHLITLASVDARGTIGFCQVPFEVIDPSPLQLICPQDMIVPCNTNGGAIVRYSVVARRSCGPADVTVSCSPPPESFFAQGTTTVVTCTAIDPQNNQTVTCTFRVTVRCDNPATPAINQVRNLSDNTVTLNWTEDAVLEEATSPGGPWLIVPNAQGSYTVNPARAKAFYRLRVRGQ